MRRRIFWSIFAASLGVLLLSLALAFGCLWHHVVNAQERQLEGGLLFAAAAAERGGVPYLADVATGALRVTLVDPAGTVLFDSDADAASMENHADRAEIRQAVETGSGASERYSLTLTEKTVYRAKLLEDGRVVRVSTSQETAFALLAGYAPWFLSAAALVALASWALAGYLARRIIAPLNALDLDRPLSNDAYEEVRPLLHKIERSERVRREFSSNVSHELKTPLTSIIASADLIENGLVKPEDTGRFIGHIKRESTRLLELIEDIIRLSRLDEGVEIPKEPVDLGAVANEVAGQLSDVAEKAGVILDVRAEPCVVAGVPRLLHEITYNLVENAVKYNVPGGRVDVAVRRGAAGVELAVADTGVGIPAEHRDRVFERFYRVDESHSKQSGGTGLGLSIVKHAAAVHGATVDLSSEVGKGTTVTLVFPA